MPLSELSLLLGEALSLALVVSAPALGAALAVGAIVAFLQAATQVQDPTLSFVPRVAAVAAALVASGAWMAERLVAYTGELWRHLPG